MIDENYCLLTEEHSSYPLAINEEVRRKSMAEEISIIGKKNIPRRWSSL